MKVTMPEPVVTFRVDPMGIVRDHLFTNETTHMDAGHHNAITTTQAEAYKDACVRELIDAAKALADWAEHDVGAWPELTPGLKEIRALIPPTE